MTKINIRKNEQAVAVALYPHPFAATAVDSLHGAGQSLSEIIGAAAPEYLPSSAFRIYIDGHEIGRDVWPRVRPKAGARVIIRCIPLGGGGGKNPLRTILSLAVMAASPVISSALTGVFGAGANFLGIVACRLTTRINAAPGAA